MGNTIEENKDKNANATNSERAVDYELVKRVQRGDKKAFDILVLKYQHKLANVLLSYIHDRDEVFDVVQESFIKAYRYLPEFRGDSAFYSWLYRIGVNTAKNHITAQNRRPPKQDVDLSEADFMDSEGRLKENSGPEKMMYSKQLFDKIEDVIENLPSELKMAIRLRENDGCNYDEIAQVMDCPVGTVRSRIFRARKIIGDEIKDLV